LSLFHAFYVLQVQANMAPPSAIEVEGVRDTEGIPQPNPLTVNGFTARRAKAGRLVAGTAAYTSSDLFKGPTAGKPKAKRWDRKSAVLVSRALSWVRN